MKRRTLLAGAAALAACSRDEAPAAPAAWVGAHHDRGHRLRQPGPLPIATVQRRAGVLVLGAGVAGLAAAHALARRGIDDVQILELEDQPGGNSRGHAMGGIACPLGAHYLPLPGPEAHEVSEWLHEIGLLKTALGRTVPDERHLCHSPQERLFVDGAWTEGLLPPVDPKSDAARQMLAFGRRVTDLQKSGAFALPAHRGKRSSEMAALNAVTFAQWLDAQGLTDSHLRWYLDYCCRDDYGAAADTVSALAGVHYFASRHGFHAPGDGEGVEREGLFTWPEGNGWLTQRLAAPFVSERLHTGRTVLRVSEGRHDAQVLAWDEAGRQAEAWTARAVVVALPLFVAARVVESPSDALKQAANLLGYAPWLVANLQLAEPLLDRPGAPPSWDNVIYGSSGLGYVDAMHQSLNAVPRATVLTAYRALPRSERAALLSEDAASWSRRVLDDIAPAHPDIHRRVRCVDLMRWGHAMAIPAPGVMQHPALAALRGARGRLRFAHADLAGYSVFEESFTAGCEAVADLESPTQQGLLQCRII